MTNFKRFGFILMVNFGVMITLSIIISFFGLGNYLTAAGINYSALLVFCFIYGMGGAFVSLLISKWMAKKMMGVEIIDESQARTADAQWLFQTVNRLSQAAGLKKMPEVGIYDSPEMNAFATGPSQSNSLVAVSTGLLQKMNRNEVEGVLAHEVAHIANGDMVTMTMVTGVVNAFGMFLARIAGHFISTLVDEEKAPLVRMIATIVFDIVFNFLGMFVVAYVSRQREYRADRGGAGLGGRDKMIAALERLRSEMTPPPTEASPMATMQISNRKGGLFALLSTHPALEDRIQRLRAAA